MMKNAALVVLGLAIFSGVALGEETVSREEFDQVKARLDQLEGAKDEAQGPWFEKLDICLCATTILQSSSGAKKALSPERDVTDATLSSDLEIAALLSECASAFAHFEAGSGDGIDGDIPTLSGFNDDADDDPNLRLTELWYEHRFCAHRIALKMGKIDLTGPCGRHESSFDANALANDECAQFLSSGFVGNLAVEFPDDNSFALVLWGSPHELIDVGLGLADADADWDNVFDNSFVILELDFKPTVAGRPGNYRLYAWLNDKDHTEIKDLTKTKEEGSGVGVSLDQELTDIVSAFARFGRQQDDVYPVEGAWSVGLQYSASFIGRQDDFFGIAYGQAKIGGDQRDVDKLTGVRTGDEDHLEAYYNFKVNDNLSISPGVQYVNNVNGDKDNGEVWAFGVRAHLSF
jgi:carbohydrate-selective porin OprB